MAQKQFDYQQHWKKAEEALQQGLPKSANTLLAEIYSQAKKDNNEPQLIKSLIYRASLVNETEEDEWKKNLTSLQAELTTAKEPAQQIIHSIIGDLYRQYFDNQRWKIYERTKLAKPTPADPETWTADDFTAAIRNEYLASLHNPQLLQQTNLSKYDAIIQKGNSSQLRPTLFDLLAHEALQFFNSQEESNAKPAYAFELNDYASLASAPIFIRYKYESKDSSSSTLAAIRIYQQLLAFHRNDANKAAFVDADIERLQFAYRISTNENKDRLYREALEELFASFNNEPVAMQAGYLLAAWWQQEGNQYKPGIGTPEQANAFRIAADLCQRVINKFPESEGGVNAKVLLQELQQSSVNVMVEKVNTVNKPFRSLLSFRNTAQVHLRIIEVTKDVKAMLDERYRYGNNTSFWQDMRQLKPLRSWTQALPAITDLRNHSAEIKVDGLSSGYYVLFASANAAFETEKNPLAMVDFYVSDISYVRNQDDYFVLHRSTGQPLAQAKVTLWTTEYDYNSRGNKKVKLADLVTDNRGKVTAPASKEKNRGYYNQTIEVSWKDDHLHLPDGEQAIPRSWTNQEAPGDADEDKLARYFFFTDRSIYRPGQTVYFKAIGVSRDQKTLHSKIYKPTKSITITLFNASYQAVDSVKLTPNELGSINGSFAIPSSGLTGTFVLEAKNYQGSQATFRVEEYKRPKFYVEIGQPEKTHKVNDTVRLRGSAKAFAGNSIDGAKVSYRVFRTARFPEPWLFWSYRSIWPYGESERQEITHGITTTDNTGAFDIAFNAIPDNSIDKKLKPVFDYIVEATVTDINGETHEEKITTSIGFQAMQLALTQEPGIYQQAGKIMPIKATTTTLNGKPVQSAVKFELYTLQTPDKLLRKRYWQAPDTFVMSKAEFSQYFPTDEFTNETDYRSWATGKQVWSNAMDAYSKKDSIVLPGNLGAGWYVLKASSKDASGAEVNAIYHFAVYSKTELPHPSLSFSPEDFQSIEPGNTASFLYGSSVARLNIIQQVEKPQIAKSDYEYLVSAKGLNTQQWKAEEIDRGGFGISRFFIYDNRAYAIEWKVQVPWSNKELQLQLQTFRNKLLPGQKETWSVTIKGSKGENTAAELLASMYDASLDKIYMHNWQRPYLWPNYNFNMPWRFGSNFNDVGGYNYQPELSYRYYDKTYDELLTIRMISARDRMMGYVGEEKALQGKAMAAAAPPTEISIRGSSSLAKGNDTLNEEITVVDANKQVEQQDNSGTVDIRKDFRETVFFFPALRTNDKGEISFEFTMPEALTSWKLQLLAHDAGLATGFKQATAITQKELMVQPNAPRFMRQGDAMEFAAKLVNLSESEMTGTATLELLDAATMKPVDGIFNNVMASQYFNIAKGQSTAVRFPIQIPAQFNSAVLYRIVAKANGAGNTSKEYTQYSDGEEMALPVLSNRMLVTESFPLNVRKTNSKQFAWNKLLQSAQNSNTLQHHALTVEYSTNPVWYAVQALPYLLEYPYDCAEQTWNRFYANALAGHILNNAPRLALVFEQWKNLDTAALLSNLQKNQQLKQILIEETPWVLQAKSETEQKKNIALLYDLLRMQNESEKAINKLAELQSPNGGFVWFKGGPDDRYMTQYIVTGIGHLRRLNAVPAKVAVQLNNIAYKAVAYLDARMREDYQLMLQQKIDLQKHQPDHLQVQYLYMRSFFNDVVIPANTKKAYDYYYQQASKQWMKAGKYQQGMLALVFHRSKNSVTAKSILKSLSENSITNDEFGMYWKEFNNPGYYWWQAPIEIHALLLEAYAEVENNTARINDLKTWLLKQKQTTNWKTTKATAEACYALLMTGSKWINAEQTADIQLGSWKPVMNKTEAGTGYFSSTIAGEKVQPEMGNIQVRIRTNDKADSKQLSSWGAVYWQYFEDLDKITPAATPLQLKKELYKKVNTDRGPQLIKITDQDGELKVGDRVVVRMEIRSDRQLEYVHIKDMRAACFEPTDALSGYQYQGGLGYYQSIRDASMNFFVSYMARGTYVFEYELVATQQGQFSNGITSIQCMYAPEFSSHSEGIRLVVDKVD